MPASDQDIVSIAIKIWPTRVHPDNLLRARDDVREAMGILDLQIAELRQRLTGSTDKQPNARWLANATDGERRKVRQRVDLQYKLGELNTLIRAQNNEANKLIRASREQRFIQLAKERLGEEAFHEIWALVNKEFDAEAK